jgi:DEAD/DEAH box helicase domain-containing protein
LYQAHRELLEGAHRLIAECQCESGCPGCVGPLGHTGPLAKIAALRILELLQAEAGAMLSRRQAADDKEAIPF